jgi:hypothetical protein
VLDWWHILDTKPSVGGISYREIGIGYPHSYLRDRFQQFARGSPGRIPKDKAETTNKGESVDGVFAVSLN